MVDARSETQVEEVPDGGHRTGRRRRSALKLAQLPAPVPRMALDDLVVQPVVRLRPVDPEHVQALAQVVDRWPAIVVAARTKVVLDGVHRVAAARLLGQVDIAVELFEGDDDAGFVEAVRCNTDHGLPLSVAERSRAATFLLASRPEWSDRAIAEVCGLDHKTVGRLRSGSQERPTGEGPRSDARVGRDGRLRPVDVVGLRTRIAEAIGLAPEASLRQIARQVGASPETVRDVRERLRRGEDPVPAGARSRPFAPLPQAAPVPPPRIPAWPVPVWAEDSACQSAPDAAEFAAWFDAGATSVEWRRFVQSVPLSRVYEIADQARAHADAWRSFAETLDRRARSEAVASQ
jgi:ParB-like chromosome segregation protein Spo0J